MKFKNKFTSGLTLVEIIVSVVILALVMAGLVNVYISTKRYILHSRARMTGGELGKAFLDPLQMDVRQDQWGNNCLSGNNSACPGAQSVGSPTITYTPTYTITPLGNGTNLTKVVLNITWNEPQ